MHFSLEPKDIEPQLLQVFIFDLYELKTKNNKINIKSGTRNKIRSILPKKLMKKLIPKIGITKNAINE